jgi:hypothetical protein
MHSEEQKGQAALAARVVIQDLMNAGASGQRDRVDELLSREKSKHPDLSLVDIIT